MIDQVNLDKSCINSALDGSWHGSPPDRFRNVCLDSREAVGGSLFTALPGNNSHGHRFLDDAKNRGATSAIVEEPQKSNLPQYVVDNSKEALQKLARFHVETQEKCYRIGITGSCGKTTVKTMLAKVLETSYRTGNTPGNYNNELGVPITLLNQGQGEVLVTEIATNSPGEISKLSNWVSPHMGILTHIGPDHLENFGTLKAVANEKADLLSALPRDGLALMPAGLKCKDILINKSSVEPIIVRNGMEFPFKISWKSENGSSKLILRDTEISLSFAGEGLLIDAALTAVAAGLLGVEDRAIKKTLEQFSPLSGRGEKFNYKQCQIIDGSYNANPDSCRDAIDRIANMDSPRLLILGDMKELGEAAPDEHQSLGEYAGELDETDIIFVGEYSDYFRMGLKKNTEKLAVYESTDQLEGNVDFGSYRSALVKASNAIGLDKFVEELK